MVSLLVIALSVGILFVTPLKSDDISNYRLPFDIVPESYTIELKPYILEDEVENKERLFTFDGNVSIEFKAIKKDVQEIVLHIDVEKLKILSQTIVSIESSGIIEIDKIEHNKTTDKYSIKLKDSLLENKKYKINFNYSGELSDDMLGFYKSSYNDGGGNKRWLVATQLAFTHARKVFPCFDEPKFKATFEVIMNIHKDLKAISNTNVLSTNEIGNRAVVTFEKSPVMPTYTLAFLISDFKERENKKFSIVARPNAYNETEYSLEVGQQFLQKLNAFTNLKYDELGINKIHMAAIPDFSFVAMENWGLVTFKERALLYNPNHTTDAFQQSITTVIAHELAHMWFGNLVTCDWWSYAWLNEGFATYFEYFITHEQNPGWEMDKQFIIALQSAFQLDLLESSHSLTMNEALVETYSQINKMFDKITYNKGAAIIRMFKHFIGDEIFKTALQKYLDEKKYSSSKPDDLFKYLAAEWKTDLDKDAFFKDWTTQVGYPLVTIKLEKDGQSIVVNQKRFLSSPDDDKEKLLYTVPLTYSLENETDIKQEVLVKTETDKKIVLDKKVNWVLGNINQTGYYRVNYDETTWYNIYNALIDENWSGISEINRAQIVDDLMNLGRSGYLSFGLVLNVLDYLKTETKYLPWTSAFNGFSFIDNKMTQTDRQIFSKFILKLLDKVYNHLGFMQKSSDTRLDIYAREKVLLWACKYGHQECISKSKQLFGKMQENIEVPLNIQAPVYCTSIREGSLNDYKYLIEKYENSNEATEKYLILTALSCTRSSDTIKLHYEYILSDKVRKQDKNSILTSLYTENPLEVFNLIVSDYKKIIESIGGGDAAVANILKGIATFFTSKTEKDLYVKFIEENKSDLNNSTIKVLESGIQLIDANINFVQTHIRKYIDHLKFKLTNKDGYRLSTVVVPSEYTIKLTPYLLENEGPIGKNQFTFDGEVSISLQTAQPHINEIILHAKNLIIEKITLNPDGNPTEFIDIVKPELNKTTDKLFLTWNGSLMQNKLYNLNFTYTGTMDDDMHGFYKSIYKDKDGKDRWLASTQFQTVHARRAFPCFDEPKFKAFFKVIINRHNTFKAVSNMKINQSVPIADGERFIDIFDPTPKMSTYILAFLVSDFKERKTEDDSFSVIARSDAYAQTEYSFTIGQQILEKFNQYTDLEYKKLGNPKMHMAAIPDFSAGAMENWGLLTYRERGLLYAANETTDSAQQSIALVIAHEQAHMWFGDYVTCDWWGYTWLNEGFARYFQYLMTKEVYPDWELDKQFVVDQIHSVMKMDSLNNTHPMSDETVESPSQVSKMFGSISYNKGATFLHMVRNIMDVNGDKFRMAIKKYLKEQEYKNSVPEDLFKYLSDEWDTNINKTEFFYDWTTQVGYPLVNLILSEDKKTITVSQERFLLKSDAGDKDLLYTIPLTFTSSKDKNFNDTIIHFLNKSSNSVTIELTDKVEWVIGNIRQIGYYRVNYDKANWHGIHHALLGKDWSGIHEINRAQIVDDLMNLGQAGYVNYSLVLNILEYLETELNYLPWTAAFNGFSTIAARIGSNDKEFGDFILYLLNTVYNQLGFEEHSDESRLDKYNRPKVLSWACKYGHRKCIETAEKYFDSLKENKTVPVNIRSAVYCSNVRNGKEEDYDYLIEKYEKSLVATEQVLILGALGCAKNDTIVEKYYNYILSEKVRRQDKSSSLTSLISQNAENPEIVFKLITKELESFQKLGKALADEDQDVAAANIMSSIANYFTNDTQIDDLMKFHNDNEDKINKKALDVIKKASKISKENIEWSENYLTEYRKYIQEFLKKKKGSASNNSINIVLLSTAFILSYFYF